MCVVSMVMDHYRERWEPLRRQWPTFTPNTNTEPAISDEEIREFRKLLDRARKYDKENGEPDCELDEKKAALKAIADKLGIDISFALQP